MSKRKSKIPRKIPNIRSSKYEATEAIHRNKKYWTNVFDEIDTTTKTEIEESRTLSKILPSNLYKKVCTTLNMPVVTDRHDETKSFQERRMRRAIKEPLLSYRKSLYIDRELDSDTDVELCSSDHEDQPNIHQEFLNKPEREQVTWATRYLQPEKEEEKSLVRKADDLTDRIATEFCEYMKQLGGDQQSQLFTPKAIKELFQIEFDTHVARSLRVVPKELPSVEDKLAIVTGNPEKSRHATLEREITKDMKAEQRPDYLTAFSQSVPLRDQRKAPRNNTKTLWRSSRHVPKDLVTLKTVWEGITNLRSVKEYCRWMIEHPEYRRAPYLSSLGMFDSAVLEARLTFESGYGVTPPLMSPNDAPAPIDNIRRRLSQLADSN
ncbi:uncharacterized protein LOC113509124 [Galleria mellonella]|uniref:Uncharacterized protein LOC113509124 n=1 Tax=Galleria mellonella TaxID=7137 RepID=A0A6J1W746_GALME|nr:uncharacterized protein LOC113509124 [Galleria mellonella]